jgi:raffinose/stachyose/melibiose transport system substrate-binding protein
MRGLKIGMMAAGLLMGLSTAQVRAEELVFWTRTNNPVEDKALKAIFAEFEAANPGVTIKMETRSTDEHKSALRIAAASKAGPDIYYMWAGLGLGGEFVKAGMSAPVDEYFAKYKWSDRLRPLADAYTQLYPPNRHGVPYQLNGEALYYNKVLFQKAGITETPKTYDELLAAAAKLKQIGIPAFTFGGSVNWHIMRLMDVVLETKCGAKTHDALKAMTVKWSETPCATESFNDFHKWTSEYTLKPFMSYDQAAARKLFEANRAAMMLEGDWFPNQLRGETKAVADFAIFPFPTGTDRLYGFGVNIYINPNGKKELAAKLLDYMISDKVQQTYLGAFGPLGINKNVVPKDPDHLDKAWFELFDKYKTAFVNGDQGFPLDVTTEYWRIINAVASDTMEPGKAAATLQAFIDKRG